MTFPKPEQAETHEPRSICGNKGGCEMGQQFEERKPVSHVKNISKTETQAEREQEDYRGGGLEG